MAVNYTPGTSGSQAVAKSMGMSSANTAGGKVGYPDGQATMPIVKPVHSPNIRVVGGKKPSPAPMTDTTGNR